MKKDRQECVVRLETVVNANVNICAHIRHDPFQRQMPKAGVEKAKKHGAWRITDDDHAFLMEESHNREEWNKYDKEMALSVGQEAEEAKKWQ